MKPWVERTLKGAASLGLLVYVFQRVGWRNVVQEVASANAAYMAVYFLLGLLAVLVSAWRWQVLCRPRSLRAGYPYLVGLYFVGMFFNQVLPTSVGGDVVRAYQLGRSEGDGAAAFASIFAERYAGLVTLVVFAAVAVPLNHRFRAMPEVWLLLALASGGVAIGSWLVFDPRIRKKLQAWVGPGRLDRAFEKAARAQAAIGAYRHHPGSILQALLLSAVFYLVAVLLTWAGCMTFGAVVPLGTLATAVPLMLLLFLLPISIGGLGLHEWAYTAVLSLVGVPIAVGLSVGLLYRARSVIFALLGGALYPFLSSRGGTNVRDGGIQAHVGQRSGAREVG